MAAAAATPGMDVQQMLALARSHKKMCMGRRAAVEAALRTGMRHVDPPPNAPAPPLDVPAPSLYWAFYWAHRALAAGAGQEARSTMARLLAEAFSVHVGRGNIGAPASYGDIDGGDDGDDNDESNAGRYTYHSRLYAPFRPVDGGDSGADAAGLWAGRSYFDTYYASVEAVQAEFAAVRQPGPTAVSVIGLLASSAVSAAQSWSAQVIRSVLKASVDGGRAVYEAAIAAHRELKQRRPQRGQYTLPEAEEIVAKYAMAGRQGHREARTAYASELLLACSVTATDAAVSEAIAWLETEAAAENSTALAILGLVYDESSHVAPDPAKALGYYRRGVDAGSAEAMLCLALVYELELAGSSLDAAAAAAKHSEAARLLQGAAGLNHPLAHRLLGVWHEHGVHPNVPVDFFAAVYHYNAGLTASEIGTDVLAGHRQFSDQFLFNPLDRRRTGAPVCAPILGAPLAVDPPEARAVAKTAADASLQAPWWPFYTNDIILARLRQCARGKQVGDRIWNVDRDRQDYARLIEIDDTQAGTRVPLPNIPALEIAAATPSSWFECSMLGRVYEAGTPDVARDPTRALTWYQRAVDAGSVTDRLAVARLHRQIGLADEPALSNFAADQCFAVCESNLAVGWGPLAEAILDGQLTSVGGQSVDKAWALALLRYSAAACAIGLGVSERGGLDRLDCVAMGGTAAARLGRASWNNSMDAGLSADVAFRHRRTAVAYWVEAADSGDTSALVALAGLLERPSGVVFTNPALAQRLYRRAVELGNINAVIRLAHLLESRPDVVRQGSEVARLYASAVAVLAPGRAAANDPRRVLADLLATGLARPPDAARYAVRLLPDPVLAAELTAAAPPDTGDSDAPAKRQRQGDGGSDIRGWASLPALLLEQVLSHLPLDAWVQCRQVCGDWYAIIRDLERRDTLFAFDCVPERALLAVTAKKWTQHSGWFQDDFRQPPGKTLAQVLQGVVLPCSCGALVDGAHERHSACVSDSDSGAAFALGPLSYARRHGGRCPPAPWKVLARNRAAAVAIAEALRGLKLPFVLAGVPNVDPAAAMWWTPLSVALPAGVPLPRSPEEVLALTTAVLLQPRPRSSGGIGPGADMLDHAHPVWRYREMAGAPGAAEPSEGAAALYADFHDLETLSLKLHAVRARLEDALQRNRRARLAEVLPQILGLPDADSTYQALQARVTSRKSALAVAESQIAVAQALVQLVHARAISSVLFRVVRLKQRVSVLLFAGATVRGDLIVAIRRI